MDFLQNHVEALVFCSPGPLKLKEITATLSEMFDSEVPESDVKNAIKSIKEKFSDKKFSFEIVHSGGGYQFLTKPEYQASISILLKQQSKRRLSNSALETLSIIAYKQPVTKAEIEQIRGVNCDYTIHKLLEKELVEMKGKSEGVGRPILYGTSERFMDHFGINSLEEMPTPKDIALEENQIGELQDIELSSNTQATEPPAESEDQKSE